MIKNKLPGVGYEITGMDLKSMSDIEIREFGKTIIEDNVLIIRDQNIDKFELNRILRCIGRLAEIGGYMKDEDLNTFMRVTNRRDSEGKKTGIFADKEIDWHSNGNNRETGRQCCVVLLCVEPGIDSITSFVDTRQAYLDLPADIKQIVDDTDCLYGFSTEHDGHPFYDVDENDQEYEFFKNLESSPDGITRPLVYTHPFSGEHGLYFPYPSIHNMWRRNGQSLDYQWLREYLINHVFQDKYIHHHNSWRKGDLIIMDQFHSLHKRNEVQGDRFLYRVVIDYSKSLRDRLIAKKHNSV